MLGALSEVAKQTSKSRHHGYDASATIFNIALFFLIAERDIQAVKVDALTHPDPWNRALYARVVLLTIHELDMDKASGTKLRSALQAVGADEALKEKAFDALRKLRAVQHKAKREFAFLRNATIAHRDANALLQYRAIMQISETKVMQLAAEFYDAADTFLGLLPQLMLEVSSMRGLARQFVQKVRATQAP